MINATVGRELYATNTITAVAPEKQPELVAEIAPNPTSDILTVSIAENEQFAEVEVFDLQGKRVLVATESVKGNNVGVINIGSLQPGLYLIKMVTKSGLMATKKIEKM